MALCHQGESAIVYVREILDVFLLALCWACTLSSSTLLTMVGPLAARNLGASAAFSPFAVGAFLIGAALISCPSAAMFSRFGRQRVFLMGCALNLVAGAFGIVATYTGQMALVFASAFCAGLSQGIGQFYRFAAMEVCDPANKPAAVTLVLTGGVVAAFVGPEVGLRTADLFGSGERRYLCSFAVVGVIGLVNAILCLAIQFRPCTAAKTAPLLSADECQPYAPPRPTLSSLMLQPRCVLAVGIATLAHTSMVMLMSPLVIAMQEAGFAERLTTLALEAHFLSMFAPGFLTGRFIAKAGPSLASLGGMFTFGGAAAMLLVAHPEGVGGAAASFAPWCAGMALCGLAWNLCFSSATVMLGSCYEPADAARVQGANDFVIFALAGAGSFCSGYIYKGAGDDVSHGWHALVFVVIGLMATLLLCLCICSWLLVLQPQLCSSSAVPPPTTDLRAPLLPPASDGASRRCRRLCIGASLLLCSTAAALATYAWVLFREPRAPIRRHPRGESAPRAVTVIGGRFVNRSGGVEQLRGSNVVVKGPPWLPAVNGSRRCDPTKTCSTFNEDDAAYFRSQGWNFVRLGVAWAGGQPTESDVLDARFVARLHALLELCERYGIRVLLDVHEDAMGSALCGEGVPMWWFEQHLPALIGAPVVGFAEALPPVGRCSVSDVATWREHAGDPEYNLKNPCCLALNRPTLRGGWGWRLLPSVGVQLTFAHLVLSADGRAAYARYVGLLAEAVSHHPAAIGIELMNEPPFLPKVPPFLTEAVFELYRECYEAVRAVSADLAVGLADAGQLAQYADDTHLPAATQAWLRQAKHLMYTFHWYNSSMFPSFETSLANAHALGALWAAAPILTEFNAGNMHLAQLADGDAIVPGGVGWAEYPYHSYCTVPASESLEPNSGCTVGEECAFGACIT